MVALTSGPEYFVYKHIPIASSVSSYLRPRLLFNVLAETNTSSAPRKGRAEGDAGCHGRLANLLEKWTDQSFDWPQFDSHRIDSTTFCTDM